MNKVAAGSLDDWGLTTRWSDDSICWAARSFVLVLIVFACLYLFAFNRKPTQSHLHNQFVVCLFFSFDFFSYLDFSIIFNLSSLSSFDWNLKFEICCKARAEKKKKKKKISAHVLQNWKWSLCLWVVVGFWFVRCVEGKASESVTRARTREQIAWKAPWFHFDLRLARASATRTSSPIALLSSPSSPTILSLKMLLSKVILNNKTQSRNDNNNNNKNKLIYWRERQMPELDKRRVGVGCVELELELKLEYKVKGFS